MSHPTCSSPLRLFAGAALLLAAGLAQAQYVWIDANGLRQYSDRPPPPSTPPEKIIKSPQPVALAIEAPPAPAPDPKAQPKKGAPTLAEREADFRKRKQEGAEQDKKAAEEAQRKQAQLENCASARQYKAQLESGIRIADTGADGERGYISDADRATRLAKANRIVAECR
jgi:outer membrane biosynthesis protein TonB